MARSRVTDYINVSKFHLLDISISIPPVLLPVFGFRSVTLPQVNVTYREVKEGNFEYPRLAAVEKAEVTTVTLEQGVSLFNSDFGDWIRKAVEGYVPSKNLLLVQFSNINVGLAGAGKKLNKTSASLPGASLGGAFGLFPDGLRLPARAWMLSRCRPVMWKPGTDFDATSGEISLAILEIKPEEVDEFSFGI